MAKSAFFRPRRALRSRDARMGISTLAMRIEIKMSFRIAERKREAHRRTSSKAGLQGAEAHASPPAATEEDDWRYASRDSHVAAARKTPHASLRGFWPGTRRA